jgi:hypothetical protein
MLLLNPRVCKVCPAAILCGRHFFAQWLQRLRAAAAAGWLLSACADRFSPR